MPNAPARMTSGSLARPSGARVARAIASMSTPASAKRIVESSKGGIAATPSLPAVQLPLQQSATVTNAARVRSRCLEVIRLIIAGAAARGPDRSRSRRNRAARPRRPRRGASREREEEAAGEDADRDPPTPAFAQRRDAKDRRAERERDERSAVLVVERVLAAVVGQHQVPERGQRRDQRPLRTQREPETGSEEAQDEDDLRADLALHKNGEHAQRVEQQRSRDLALIAAEARVTAEVLIRRAGGERGNDHLQRHDERDEAARDHDRARAPAALERERDAEPDADERDLFLREQGEDEAEDHRHGPPRREEVHRESERRDRERDLVEVVENDERQRRAEQVRRDPHETLRAGRKGPAREKVDWPRAERERERLRDDQRLGVREERVRRHEQQQRRREVGAEK